MYGWKCLAKILHCHLLLFLYHIVCESCNSTGVTTDFMITFRPGVDNYGQTCIEKCLLSCNNCWDFIQATRGTKDGEITRKLWGAFQYDDRDHVFLCLMESRWVWRNVFYLRSCILWTCFRPFVTSKVNSVLWESSTLHSVYLLGYLQYCISNKVKPQEQVCSKILTVS